MKRVTLLIGLMLIIFSSHSAAHERKGMTGMGEVMHEMMGIGSNPWYHHGVTLMLQNTVKLNLSKDQVRQLEEIRVNYTKDIIRQEAELKIAEMDLDKLLEADDVDLSKTKDTLKKAEGVETQIRYLRIEAFAEARKVLTYEQRLTLRKLMERSPGMEEMMGGMMKGMTGGKEAGAMAQEKAAGEVNINAAFKNPEDAGGEKELAFTVKLDTHTVNLDAYSFDKSVLLKDERGRTYSPVSVETSGSGHHREAEIRFKNPGRTKSIEFLLKDVAGVKETVFKWELKEGAM